MLPGFIDVHTHAAIGIDVNGCSVDELIKLSEYYASKGVTGYLPTTTTLSSQSTDNALRLIVSNVGNQGSEILGIHMEGPFLNETYRGSQSAEYLRVPLTQDLEHYVEISNGLLRLVTLAPELPGAMEAIKYLHEQGIAVNIGHSDATFAQSEEAFNKGAGCVSHFLNGMRAFHQHEPSIIGNVFYRDDVYVELICDGFHLVPDTVRVVNKILGIDRIILITDSTIAAGLPDGQYESPAFTEPVVVKNGDAQLLYTKSRAGSTITLDRAFRNFISYTGVSLEHAVRCTSYNPAKHIGLDHKRGTLEPGKIASFTLLDKELNVTRTIINGKTAFSNRG